MRRFPLFLTLFTGIALLLVLSSCRWLPSPSDTGEPSVPVDVIATPDDQTNAPGDAAAETPEVAIEAASPTAVPEAPPTVAVEAPPTIVAEAPPTRPALELNEFPPECAPVFYPTPGVADDAMVEPTPSSPPNPTDMFSIFTFSVHERTNVIITDPQGRRLGNDCVTGEAYREIPNGDYALGSSDFNFFAIYNPQPGDYQFRIEAFETGNYQFFGSLGDETGMSSPVFISVTLSAGDVITETGYIPATASESPMPPEVQAGESQTASVNVPVQFSGTITDINPNDSHQTRWDFGDGATATDTLTPQHTYTSVGEYEVTLTVTDTIGFVISDTLHVTIQAAP